MSERGVKAWRHCRYCGTLTLRESSCDNCDDLLDADPYYLDEATQAATFAAGDADQDLATAPRTEHAPPL